MNKKALSLAVAVFLSQGVVHANDSTRTGNGSQAVANSAVTNTDSEHQDANPHFTPKVLTQQPIIVLPPLADDRAAQYKQATQEESVLTPDEVMQFRQYLLDKERAAHQITPPKMRSKSHSISLSPGSAIPKISIAPRYVSSLVIVDSQGNPWPIVGHNNGSPHVFQTSVQEAEPFNVMSIAALMNVGVSNLAIQLEGQSVPLIVEIEVNPSVMDIRADMVVDQVGPRSNPLLRYTGGDVEATPGSVMMAFVDGVPPKGAVPLGVSDDRFRVWELGGELYIRTGVHVSTPRHQGISFGTGGVRVYRMKKTPVALFNADGKVGTLRITLNDIRSERGRN